MLKYIPREFEPYMWLMIFTSFFFRFVLINFCFPGFHFFRIRLFPFLGIFRCRTNQRICTVFRFLVFNVFLSFSTSGYGTLRIFYTDVLFNAFLVILYLSIFGFFRQSLCTDFLFLMFNIYFF